MSGTLGDDRSLSVVTGRWRYDVFDESAQETRLERLLARHRDAVVAEPVRGRPTLVRRDQILVAAPDAPAVEIWRAAGSPRGRMGRASRSYGCARRRA